MSDAGLSEEVNSGSEENFKTDVSPLEPKVNKPRLFSGLALAASIIGLIHISLLLSQLHYNGQAVTTSYFYVVVVGSLLMVSLKRNETFNKLNVIAICCVGLCVFSPITVGLFKILSAIFYIIGDLVFGL
jgi:phosphatidylserine synthase